MRILIAEEEFASRKVLSRSMGRYGACDIAVDGMEATFAYVDSIEHKEYYDVICMDLELPVVDGSHVLYNIRTIEKEKKIPEKNRPKIIFLSADTSGENQEKAKQAGGDYLLHKPVEVEELIRCMEEFK